MSASRPARLSERLRRGRRAERAGLRAAKTSHLDDLVVITGFSGAGKSTAMAVFEDAGYFCVDNLPPEMIRSLAELFMHPGSAVERAAIVSDVRGGTYFEGIISVLSDLDRQGVSHRLIFLECDDQTLLTRYQETRRRHPLAPEGTVAEGVAAERALLEPIREQADLVVDTSGLTTAMLRRKLADELLPAGAPARLAVTFTSFGHKHGPPRDADLAFDVRFLPNPHYEESMPAYGPRSRDRGLHRPRRGPAGVLRPRDPAAGLPAPAVRPRGQGTPARGDRVHGRPAPVSGGGGAPGAALPGGG